MLARCIGGEDLHRSTIQILEVLGPFRWDAKMVVALASFTHSYGVFWLVLQMQSENALSHLLAVVRRIPSTVTFMRPRFKALNLLVGTILRLTRLLISYESWSAMHEMVDNQDREMTRSKICLACYWICRSLLVCFSQIADLRNFSLEQVHVLSIPCFCFLLFSMSFQFMRRVNSLPLFLCRCSDRAVVAAWGLYSLGNKLSCLCNDLGECIDTCQQQIGCLFVLKIVYLCLVWESKAVVLQKEGCMRNCFMCLRRRETVRRRCAPSSLGRMSFLSRIVLQKR